MGVVPRRTLARLSA